MLLVSLGSLILLLLLFWDLLFWDLLFWDLPFRLLLFLLDLLDLFALELLELDQRPRLDEAVHRHLVAQRQRDLLDLGSRVEVVEHRVLLLVREVLQKGDALQVLDNPNAEHRDELLNSCALLEAAEGVEALLRGQELILEARFRDQDALREPFGVQRQLDEVGALLDRMVEVHEQAKK